MVAKFTFLVSFCRFSFSMRALVFNLESIADSLFDRCDVVVLAGETKPEGEIILASFER